MLLSSLDWLLLILFLLFTLFIGFRYSGTAGKNISEFFLSGRKLPWYIAGVSMVATTFAADTPLAVTELVAQSGIAGNWLWWNMLIGGMLTTFFFARYWRRAGVLTEAELIELRYGGEPASALRAFKAVYLGLIMNMLVIAWVNLAMISILQVFFGLEKDEALLWVLLLATLIALYSAMAGLWGVALNDVVQFFIAMAGSVALAWFVLDSEQIGGIQGLRKSLPDSAFSFFPTLDTGAAGIGTQLSLGFGAFLAFIGFQWWASWYPGAEPGGGGYIAQRMMSARSEKDALGATLLFQVAHYCIRPWPWIIVGLAALVLYPELPEADKKLGYVMAMKDFLPNGWRGLMLVAFIAAYMSTLSTQLNWGASYLVNDFLPKIGLGTTDNKRQITQARVFTLVLMLAGFGATLMVETISGVWAFIIECGAGLGLVLILRWYWWRISAWSEIAATFFPFVFYGLAKLIGLGIKLGWFSGDTLGWLSQFPGSYFLTVGGTTIGWLLVTYLTPPESEATLSRFAEKVRPSGWWPNTSEAGRTGIPFQLLAWVSAVIGVYAALFSAGNLILGFYDRLLQSGIVLVIAFALLLLAIKKGKLFQ